MRTLIAAALPLLGLLAACESEAAGLSREEFTLPNGLRVRLVSAPADGELTVILGLAAGFLAEPAGRPHVAHVAEHLVVFGGQPGSDEAKAADRWFAEGRANGETLLPCMYFDLHVRSDDLAAAVRVQASRLAGPTFTREVLDREVPRTLSEVEQVDRLDEGYTAKFAALAFVQAAFHEATEIPLRTRTRALTVDDVRGFWSRSARPDRAILSVIGAFDPAKAREEIEAAFGSIPRPSGPAIEPGPLRSGHVTATWDLRARHLLIAWPAPPPGDPDHPALTVAAHLLTQSLLADADINALTNWPSVSNEADRCFLINAYVRPGADPGSLEAKILDRVGKLARPDAPAILESVRTRAAVGQLTSLIDIDAIPLPPGVSRSSARANIELQSMTRELAWGDATSYRKRLGAVDSAAVRDAVARHLDPARATIVRLGPAVNPSPASSRPAPGPRGPSTSGRTDAP